VHGGLPLIGSARWPPVWWEHQEHRRRVEPILLKSWPKVF